ncbi:MAG: permease [Desulfuromonadales bacterium]
MTPAGTLLDKGIKLLRSQWLLLSVVVLYLWAFQVAPERAQEALAVSGRTFGSVLLIIISVFGLMGLLQVWISRDKVAAMLGKEGGWKALVIAAACGTVLIGPAYIIFPLLQSIRAQGARWAVITAVLAAYAVKIPMIPLEVQFLGWSFSISRSVLTILTAIPIGLLVEAIMEWRPASYGDRPR